MRKQRIVSSGSGKRAVWPAPRTFITLEDCPNSYTGKAGQLPVVNATETGLEFKTEAVVDEYKVKSDATDPTGDYLNGKTDNAGIEVDTTAHKVRLKDSGHDFAGVKHAASTKAQVDAKISDADLYSTLPGEIAATTLKASPTGADKLLINDAADSDKVKSIAISTLPAATPAAHDFAGTLHNASTKAQVDAKISDADLYSTLPGEIAATTLKASPTGADKLLINDAADGDKVKSIAISTLPASTPAAHDFAGTLHNADTKANIDSKCSDADFISTLPGEINLLTNKSTLADADYVLIEDSADLSSGKPKKKYITAGKIKRYDHIRWLIKAENFQGNYNNPEVYSTINYTSSSYYCKQFRKALQDIVLLQIPVHNIRWNRVSDINATLNIHLWTFPTTDPGANNSTYWYCKAFHIPQGQTVNLGTTGSDANQTKIVSQDNLIEVLMTGVPINIPAGSVDADGLIVVKISRDPSHANDTFAGIMYSPFAAVTAFLDGA